PATKATGTLYVLARCNEGNTLPLRLCVNGKELPGIQAPAMNSYRWYEVSVKASALKSGNNTVEFWTDATAMNAWSLAIEGGHTKPNSFLSDDGGRIWRNEKM